MLLRTVRKNSAFATSDSVTKYSTLLWMGAEMSLRTLLYLLRTFTTGRVTVSIMPDTVYTLLWAPDDGWSYHPKHVEQFADINKLCIVASCWTIIDTYYAMHGPLNIKYSLLTERKTFCIKRLHNIYSNLSNASHSYRFNRIEMELHFLL